jgi:hypothetical protein
MSKTTDAAMKRNYSLRARRVALGTAGSVSAQQASRLPVIEVQQPVIIAFYPAASIPESASAESTESLSNFLTS